MHSTCRFLGAAGDIGRLGMTLESGSNRFLFDYGLAPDRPPQYPIEAPPVDEVFLTHAHLDHTGMIPWLTPRMEAAITTTACTAELSSLMHKDALKVARSEGFPQPYSDADIADTETRYDPLPFGEPRQAGDLEVTLESAGHIPGAAQVCLRGDTGTAVFTGDLYTRPQRLVGPGRPVECDVLFIETTYAGREHPDRADVEADFLAHVQDVVGRGGQVLAAAFSVGRAQELAMLLAGRGYSVWMDGMARSVSQIFAGHPDNLADARRYKDAIREVKMIWSHRGRGVALREADVILTTSGMLDGGPILHYLRERHDDPLASVVMTGYQVPGTNGRRLLDDGVVDLDTREPGQHIVNVDAEVRRFDFSAHAGHKDLVDFARATGADDIVLFHGDNREALVDDMSDFAKVHLPQVGEAFTVGQ